ncbi:MAG: FAD-dependent oxidoreductase [Coriobacteriia bacterium]|nr:FAD-dependent oxidoreductase [Coriobacteriia bacterium]MCL2749997.1 FAD-dependent oxidoreductase [Coriobacteriia bacterium]
MSEQFPHLLKPGKIGKWELPNRVVASPMGTLNGDSGGFVTDRATTYYTELAKGGMGLLVVEATHIDTHLSKAEDNQLGIWSNEHVTGMARLASCIQDQGVKAVLQLCHIGRQISLADRCESLGPSEMVEMMGGVYPFPIRGITRDEIAQMIEDFATCAWRAKMAGFDGVQVHGAIGHLINMFCTPFYNRRTDEYGGTPENRIRFFVEIVEAIHKKCGKDFPVLARITGCDFDSDRGLTLEEGILHAKMLEEAGCVAMHIVGGSQRNIRVINCQYDPRGDFVCIAESLKKAGIKVPVIIDGGLSTPDIAEKALSEGRTDFVGLGRPLLADTEWAKKAKEGRPEDIIPCIRCVVGCVGPLEKFNAAHGLRCSVNPRCNMAGHREVAPIDRKKKICVVGGGPAGMEAARLAAVRGHEVTLYEKRKLGGMMHEAAFDLSVKEDIQLLIDYYVIQMGKLGVKVITTEVTANEVVAGGYDAVIVATGAKPVSSYIPGSDNPKVIPLVEYAGNRDCEVGETVLVVGGCFPNVEMAYALAKKGKRVIITTRRGKKGFFLELGEDNSGPMQQRLLALIMQYKVDVRMGKNVTEITEQGVILTDVDTNDSYELACDSIVLCRGYSGGGPKLYKELQGKVAELYKAGDCQMKSRCLEYRVIDHAILEGWQVGNRV